MLQYRPVGRYPKMLPVSPPGVKRELLAGFAGSETRPCETRPAFPSFDTLPGAIYECREEPKRTRRHIPDWRNVMNEFECLTPILNVKDFSASMNY
jgi:hypothetical protein